MRRTLSEENLNLASEKATLEQELEQAQTKLVHIKELFEIRSDLAIVPKMNEVYVALSEVQTGKFWFADS